MQEGGLALDSSICTSAISLCAREPERPQKMQKLQLTGESLSPGVSSVKKFRPPPAPELCRADDVLDRAARTEPRWRMSYKLLWV